MDPSPQSGLELHEAWQSYGAAVLKILHTTAKSHPKYKIYMSARFSSAEHFAKRSIFPMNIFKFNEQQENT